MFGLKLSDLTVKLFLGVVLAAIIGGIGYAFYDQGNTIAALQGENKTLSESNTKLDADVKQVKQDCKAVQQADQRIDSKTEALQGQVKDATAKLDDAIADRTLLEQRLAELDLANGKKSNGVTTPSSKTISAVKPVEYDAAWETYCKVVPANPDCVGGEVP